MMENKFWARPADSPFSILKFYTKAFSIQYIQRQPWKSSSTGVYGKEPNMPVKIHHHNGKAVQIPTLLCNNCKTLFLVIELYMWSKYWLMVTADHSHNKVQNANALWKTVIDSIPSWLYAYWYLGCLSNLNTKYNTESNLLSQLPQIYYLIHTYILRLKPKLCCPKCLSRLETSNRHSWRL